jgi:succinate dehydrogenase / fumarate reductase cytochrome b subunit
MGTLLKPFNSTVGRKLIMGLTGVGLLLFVIIHLIENLLLYVGPDAYNGYVARLHSFGIFLTFAEIGLFGMIIVHAIMATWITTTNRSARGPERYAMTKSKGDPSRSNIASRNMIITGLVLLGFLIYHLLQFRFGVVTTDLYGAVATAFHDPVCVGIYVVVMLFLGLHFRHGFWSAFQSLGAMSPQLSKPMYCVGLLIGVLLALGFISIPVWFYFGAH